MEKSSLFASFFRAQRSRWMLSWNFFHKHFFAPILSVLYPSDCPACLQLLGRFHIGGICLNCWSSIKLIRPPYCSQCGIPLETTLCTSLNPESFLRLKATCHKCKRKKHQFVCARSLGEYTGSLREIIHYYKFNKKSYLSEPLADLMMKILDIRKMFGRIDAIIAVPLHRKRKKERGFNQSFLIAKRLGRKLKIKVERRALSRIKKSIPQMDLPAHQREKNVMGAFKLRKVKRIRDKRILLIDDVMTTGATVNECARVLQRSGSKEIFVLTIAYTPASMGEQFPY